MGRLITVLICLLSAGCIKHIDPPLFLYDTAAMTQQSAHLHAKDVHGDVYKIDASKHSMEPLLLEGDLIVVAKLPYSSLVVGQVITYMAAWNKIAPVTHRLVQHDNDGWILSGDNNPRSEPQYRVIEKDYVGTVVGIYRTKP